MKNVIILITNQNIKELLASSSLKMFRDGVTVVEAGSNSPP